MQALVVYESLWGNTEKVARVVGKVLTPVGTVDVMDSDSAPGSASGYGLVVVGGPTQAFSMTRPATRAEAVKSHSAPHAPTRGIRGGLTHSTGLNQRFRPSRSILESTSRASLAQPQKRRGMNCGPSDSKRR